MQAFLMHLGENIFLCSLCCFIISLEFSIRSRSCSQRLLHCCVCALVPSIQILERTRQPLFRLQSLTCPSPKQANKQIHLLWASAFLHLQIHNKRLKGERLIFIHGLIFLFMVDIAPLFCEGVMTVGVLTTLVEETCLNI